MMVAMTRGSLTVSRRSNHPRSSKPYNKKKKKKKKGVWKLVQPIYETVDVFDLLFQLDSIAISISWIFCFVANHLARFS